MSSSRTRSFLRRGESVASSELIESALKAAHPEQNSAADTWDCIPEKSLDDLEDQLLRGKSLEMLQKNERMWSGHLGEVTAAVHGTGHTPVPPSTV